MYNIMYIYILILISYYPKLQTEKVIINYQHMSELVDARGGGG